MKRFVKVKADSVNGRTAWLAKSSIVEISIVDQPPTHPCFLLFVRTEKAVYYYEAYSKEAAEAFVKECDS